MDDVVGFRLEKTSFLNLSVKVGDFLERVSVLGGDLVEALEGFGVGFLEISQLGIHLVDGDLGGG